MFSDNYFMLTGGETKTVVASLLASGEPVASGTPVYVDIAGWNVAEQRVQVPRPDAR